MSPIATGRYAAVAAIIGGVLASSVWGQTEPVRGSVIPPVARDVINATMSPFCPGLSLATCPSPSADSLRKAIVLRVEAGEGYRDITEDLVATYGERVRAAPAARGFGLVAWIAPFAALLLACVWLTIMLRRAEGRLGSVGVAPRGLEDRTATPAELETLSELLREDRP